MRILLLARHYPPAVSGGAKRPFLLAAALRKANVEVRVCAPSLPPFEPGWEVPHPSRDPPTASAPRRFSLRAFARDLLLWPDPDIRWCLKAAQTALADGWRPDWVMSTSPPESIHVAGEMIARRTGARWAADFRDLWLSNPHRHERRRLHRKIGERLLARRLLPKADVVTAVDPVVAAEAKELGAQRPVVLPHFVADEPPARACLPENNLNVVHAGSISLSDPDARIEQMLEPFERAARVNPRLHLHLIGRLTDQEQNAVETSGARAGITVHGLRPLAEALSFMAAADALIFVASSKMHVPPSKIVDYLQFDAPIVACGEGTWRNDPRVPHGDPSDMLAGLTKGARRNVALKSPAASETARQLIAMLERPNGELS